LNRNPVFEDDAAVFGRFPVIERSDRHEISTGASQDEDATFERCDCDLEPWSRSNEQSIGGWDLCQHSSANRFGRRLMGVMHGSRSYRDE
jgi:hypothetical protein